MTDLQNPEADNAGAGGEALPSADAATRIRALGLALDHLEGVTSPPLARLSALVSRDVDLHGLARAVAEQVPVSTRVGRLTPAHIEAIAGAGGAVVLPRPEGFIVVSGRAGRRVRGWLVTRAGQRRIPVRADRIPGVGTGPVPALVVEPRLPLQSLSAQVTGSTTPWARLWAAIALERPELGALVVYAVIVGALSLAVPVAVQVLVNTIALGSLLQPLVVLVILLAGVLVLSGAIQVVGWYAVEVLQRRVFVRIAEDFAQRLLGAGTALHDRMDVRELANRFFEVVTLQKTLGRLLLDGLGLALQTLVGMTLLGFYHPVLLAFDAGLVLALGVVIALGYGAVPTAVRESKAKYRVAAWLETLAARPSAFGGAKPARVAAAMADALTRDYLTARRAHYRRVLRQLVGGVGVQVVTLVALLGLGGWLVMEGELTLGQLVAAELVVGVIGAGFAKTGKHLESVYDLLASLDKVGQVVDLPAAPAVPDDAPSDPWPIEVRGIRTGRHGGRSCVPIDARIGPGTRVQLTGASGAGKSVLLEVLAGLRTPNAGGIAVGGLERAPSPTLRSVAWLLRPDDAVGGTIWDNLRLGDPELDEARAWELLRTVALADRVAGMDAGLQSWIPTHGGPLSRAEVARLCLARAIAARPPLLLVDGALDPDVLGLEPVPAARLLDEVLGAEAPWSAVVVTDDDAVAVRCPDEIDLDVAPEALSA